MKMLVFWCKNILVMSEKDSEFSLVSRKKNQNNSVNHKYTDMSTFG